MRNAIPTRMIAGLLLSAALDATAAPVNFDASAASLTPGSGYGVDSAESSGTLLDILFTTTFVPQNFSLSAVGSSQQIAIGVLDFRESNGSGGILAAETDGLGVTATLTFVNPLGATQVFITTGVAVVGPINGGGDGIDYTLSWTALTNIAFGSGGLFDISLNTITFSATNDADQVLNATVTLRALSSEPSGGGQVVTQANGVPGPGSLSLWVAGLALAGWARRLGTRRRAR